MFMCQLATKVFEYEPVWGCQSEPDDYIAVPTVDTLEMMALEQLKNRVFAAFMETILNANVEYVQIDTADVYNKWPDEWGATRTEKRLTWGKYEHKDLSKIEVKLNNSRGGLEESYARDGVSFVPNEKSHYSVFKECLRSDMSVQIIIHERSTLSPLFKL